MARKASKKTSKQGTPAAAATGSPPEADSVSDYVSIHELATTTPKRRAALAWCLANAWAGTDIGSIERTDTADWHGWEMWLRV